MRVFIFSLFIMLWFQGYVFATVSVRNDRPSTYMVIYYSDVYVVAVARDHRFDYIVIPGAFGSEELSIEYWIYPEGLMYPISSGLPYQWRIQTTEGHHIFKKDRR